MEGAAGLSEIVAGRSHPTHCAYMIRLLPGNRCVYKRGASDGTGRSLHPRCSQSRRLPDPAAEVQDHAYTNAKLSHWPRQWRFVEPPASDIRVRHPPRCLAPYFHQINPDEKAVPSPHRGTTNNCGSEYHAPSRTHPTETLLVTPKSQPQS